MIYSDEMGYSESASTTLVAMTGSPYYPLIDGRLIQVKLGASGDAVTTLIENVTVKLTSPKWGVPLYVTVEGNNLRTATVPPIPKGVQNCDLPVKTGSKITIEVMNRTGATPVTPRYQLIGVFEG
ncbi:unnamed protein product [marine sediment metagenome]|uniref:Uncharacterized protein n=1 Tax=marine sediment metagenome TaxID=412755 RepID=X1LKL1_9ZZZZ